jgi:hypothetical protein
LKKLASIALILVSVPAVASAAGESFPVSGQVQLSYRTPHSTFVPSEGGSGFGGGAMRLATSFFWSPDSVPSLTLAAGFNFQRAVSESFDRAPGSPQIKPKITQFSDISLGLNWNFAQLGPVTLTAGLSNSIGLSNVSRHTGQVFSTSPSITATVVTPFGLIASVSGSAGVNINRDPTVQVTDAASAIRRVSGGDTGQSNQAGSTGWSAGLSYQAFPGLFLSTSYFMDKSFSAVLGPDDEATSEYAQTGVQSGDPAHGAVFVVRYQMKQLGGGAAAAFNKAAEGKAVDADPWTNHVAISAGMVTQNRLFDPDNKSLSNPFFDTESNTHGRTLYVVTLTGMM